MINPPADLLFAHDDRRWASVFSHEI